MNIRNKLKKCICGHSKLEHQDECLGCHVDNKKTICTKFRESKKTR